MVVNATESGNHQGCVMSGGVVKNHFGISVTCQVTLLRQVCMTSDSPSALTVEMCPLMGFLLSAQSLFGVPGFLGSSSHSACNLKTIRLHLPRADFPRVGL